MKTDIKLVLMTIIAMFAMIGGFSWAVGLQINPLKENQARFETELQKIKDLLMEQREKPDSDTTANRSSADRRAAERQSTDRQSTDRQSANRLTTDP